MIATNFFNEQMPSISISIISFILLFLPFIVNSQAVFEERHDIQVSEFGQDIAMPWAGGLNSCQYNKADLDGDGIEELILYDRSANIYQIFKADNGDYLPANELSVLLPEIPTGWVLFVDYNQDGKKDIFSSGKRGVVVFKNITISGEPATWEKVADPLLTTGYSGKINLIVNVSDIPAISDVDADGDFDILVYNFAIGGYIRFHKNLSQELYGHSDSLEYKIYSRTWGEFQECECNEFAFHGEDCDDHSNGRIAHIGGKSLLAIDIDGDGDKDLLSGQEQCQELYFFENMGDKDSAFMIGFSNMFPDQHNPANFQIFPSAFFEDLDFDGTKDLIVAPGVSDNYNFKIDFSHSNWFYKNTGTDESPIFIYKQNNFLQQEMMDFGELSCPAKYDLDNDGKTDILVSANGHGDGDKFIGMVIKITNTGSTINPSFEIADKNYLDLASLNLTNPKIDLIDFDDDQAVDLIYSGLNSENKLTSWLILNDADHGEPVSFDISKKQKLQMPSTMTIKDTPTFFDVDEDGFADLLIGKRAGALEYHRNNGNEIFELVDPSFLGIERDFTLERGYLVPSIADLDLDGNTDLITTDFSGEGRVYYNFQQQTDGDALFVTLSYKNLLTNKDEPIKFDSHSWVSSVDLFNQGTESIVVGGIRGGLQFYQNISTGTPGDNSKPIEVNIYPNPIIGPTGLNIEANQQLNVELLSVLGQTIMESFTVKNDAIYNLDVGHLRNGMYILRTNNDAGMVSSKLFFILK